MGRITIAIDGHASTGKGTMARELARELGYIYIDSGAMYRGVTLLSIRHGLSEDNEHNCIQLLELLHQSNLEFRVNKNSQRSELWMDGMCCEAEIRTPAVTKQVSAVSAVPAIREALVELQRKWGAGGGVVMEGRDIGSVVFPNAELKIFMTASPEVRAQRRFREWSSQGKTISYEEVLADLVERDHLDSTRAHSPLVQVPEARVLDNSELSPSEQLQLALSWARETIEQAKT